MLIELDYLYNKYHINATGVLHIGASTGQEAEKYHKHGLKVVWIEAIPEVFKQLKRNVLQYTGSVCINACVSDRDGDMVDFNISNNEGQSSSMFEFGTHTIAHPGIVFTNKLRLHTLRVDSILKERNIPAHEYDFVNLDIQGAELKALKGMDLSHVRYVYCEVNVQELYKGIPLLPEIDEYLLKYDLHRVETNMTNWGWGDAFYIRKQRDIDNTVQVPDQFRPKHPFAYPGDNDTEFERWFMQNYRGVENGRTYLPVMWTAYYCLADRNRNKSGVIASLQKFLDHLDKSKKYFTIVQYDDGILNKLDHLDIKVFSMSGKPMDYALPLICKDHTQPLTKQITKKSIFASFIGRNTHTIRAELLKLKQPGWVISDRVRPMHEFCTILADSVFTLCPRGYGPTSFRTKEAMQYGSIPVYISDEFIEPHGIDFNIYGVKVTPDQVKDLPRILSEIKVIEKQQAVKEVYEKWFTFEANKLVIESNICCQ